MTALIVPACLLAVGIAGGAVWLRRGGNETANGHGAAREVRTVAAEAPAAVPVKARPRPAKGSVIGKFEVPSLNMSWTVLEGTDDAILEQGVGHIEGTAGLGDAGNIGLAAHRNTHFRKLEWLRKGAEIVLTNDDGVFHYRVDYMKLHKQTDVDVLDRSHGASVTLVTCFPFEYVGSAPLRYIIRAVAVQESLTRLLPLPPVRGAAAVE